MWPRSLTARSRGPAMRVPPSGAHRASATRRRPVVHRFKLVGSTRPHADIRRVELVAVKQSLVWRQPDSFRRDPQSALRTYTDCSGTVACRLSRWLLCLTR